MKNVTVIVPVYGDWETLSLCIESLKKYLDKRHKVLLINDMGPEWKMLETNILEAIQGCEHFEYHKNDENMGFVKTCNRGILELDETDNDIFLLNSDTKVTEGFMEEMLRILYQAEKHGVVCPRSNNATLLTVPVHKRPGKEFTPEESYQLYQAIKPHLPEKQILPTGVGFAFLIKRNLLTRFGVLDEVYGKGYNEENDLCMRINQYGYNVVQANYAFVYHYESKSFGTLKQQLDAVNGRTLSDRYPYYMGVVHKYFDIEMDCVDYFADLLVPGIYKKPRVLISLFEIPCAFNGTAEYGLSILDAFYKLYSDKYDISVLVNDAAGEFFKLRSKYPSVYYPFEIRDESFDIAFAPSQIFHMEHMFLLNRICLRYIFCMQDIISIRTKHLVLQDFGRMDLFKQSIRYCDAMASISDFSLNDTKAYYSAEFERRNIPTKVIYHGTGKNGVSEGALKQEVPYEKYFMIFGNFYRHKFIDEIMDVLKKSKYNFVLLGSRETGQIAKNIYGYKSGMLSDELIEALVYRSVGILFPSVYEGFGLPILNGIDYDKKIIVNNNELNRELKAYLHNYGTNNITMFDEVDEIEGLLDAVYASPEVVYECGHKTIRTWTDSAKEVGAFVEEILEQPVDIERLRDRWDHFKNLEFAYHSMTPGNPEQPRHTRWLAFKIMLRDYYPGLFNFLRKIKYAVKG